MSFLKSYVPLPWERYAHGILGTLSAFLTTLLFLRKEKRTFASIGLSVTKGTVVKFLAGCGIGLLLMTVMVASLVYLAQFKLKLNGEHAILPFLLWTLALLPLAFMEEVAFRGYPLVMLQQRVGIRVSLIVTAILFALYHVANGWLLSTSLLGAGVWALVYGLAAVYSNGISMPTGIHYAANVVQAAVGMSKGFTPLWILEQKGDMPVGDMQWIGTIVQVALLVTVVMAIEFYVRKKSVAIS